MEMDLPKYNLFVYLQQFASLKKIIVLLYVNWAIS